MYSPIQYYHSTVQLLTLLFILLHTLHKFIFKYTYRSSSIQRGPVSLMPVCLLQVRICFYYFSTTVHKSTTHIFDPIYISISIAFVPCHINYCIWKELCVVDNVWYSLNCWKLNEKANSQGFFKKESTYHVRDTL